MKPSTLFQRIGAVMRRRRMDAELDEELRFHLALQIEENRQAGMSEAEARRVALRDFGGVERTKEEHRDMRGAAWVETLWRDLRMAGRSMRRNPALTSIAMLTMALGIGANTSIYTVMHAVLLEPLSYPEPERIVRVWPETPVNTEFLYHYRERARAFEALAVYGETAFTLSGSGRPEEISGASVTPDYFTVLGVGPFLGRAFAPDESDPGHAGVVILSYALWQRLFGGEESAIGKSLAVNGRKLTVIGVMPSGYTPLQGETQLWAPLEIDPAAEEHWDMISYGLLGRLRPGVPLAQVRDDLNAAIRSYAKKRPGYLGGAESRGGVVQLQEMMVGSYRATLLLLAGAVLLVLLIACANVASLLVARITGQRTELALRNALGAGAARLVSQVLVHSVLLSLGGGALGVLAAQGTLAALVDQLPATMTRTASLSIDSGVFAFAILLSVVAGVVFGLPPAWRAGRVDPQMALVSIGRGGVGARHRMHHALIAVEIAVAVVLVVGAGLLVRSFRTLQQVDVGFSRENIVTMALKLAPERYPDELVKRNYFQSVAERVAATPGVESAGLINRLPMTSGEVGMAFQPADRDLPPGVRSVSVRLVTPAVLETLRIPLLRGRTIGADDRADTPAVGLVNQAFATQLWGGDDPVGDRLVFGNGELWFTVVGVVGDIRQHRLDQATKPQVYRPVSQSSWDQRMALVVRTSAERHVSQREIEEAIWSVDPEVPVTSVATMDQVIRRSLQDSRLLTSLFSLFGLLALSLGLVGVFGVTSYAVGQRTRENGVRMALGATAGEVVRGSVRRAMTPVAIGLAAGAVAALGLARLLDGFLYEVTPADPGVFAGAIAMLGGCGLLASYLPARRAARINPVEALRHE